LNAPVFGSSQLLQPDGSTSTISFVTVGGRTSAVVDRIQVLPEGLVKSKAKGKRKMKEEEEEEEVEVDGSDGKVATPKKKRQKAKGTENEEASKWTVRMIEEVALRSETKVTMDADSVETEVEGKLESSVSRTVVSLHPPSLCHPSIRLTLCASVLAVSTFQAI
jgi:formamidopyrimidine-DNA glycosylase